MQVRQVVATLCFAALACSNDGSGPVAPGPPPPPTGPVVATVTNAPGPSQLVIQNDVLYWLDSSRAPFKKLSLTIGAAAIALFTKSPMPDNELSDGSYVYWVSSGRLYRSTVDGSTTIRLDSADIPSSGAIAMDGGYVYWVASAPSACSPPCRWSIRRVPKGGGAATEVAMTADGVVDFMALAVAGGYVFWEEGGVGPAALDGSVGSKIIKVPVAGGTASTVVDGMENGLIVPPGPGYIPASWHPRGGIIPDTDVVYFADADFYQSYRVMSVSVNGGPINILLADTTHDGNNFVRSMTSDATTLYWVDLNKVRSMAKTDGMVTDLNGPRAIPLWSVTRAGSNLYFLEATCCAHRDKGTIYTIPTTGGTPVVVHDSLDSPSSLTSDATHMFWLEGGAGIGAIEGFGSMRASALNGANTLTLVETANGGPFAADANAIYFADKWTIKKISTAGGLPQRVATGDFYIKDIATDGVNLYWLEDGPFSVVRYVPVSGGSITTLGAGPGPAGRLRIGGPYVYWLGHDDEIDRVPKAGGQAIRLIGPISGLATDFAIDLTSIYISGWDSGIISKAPIDGGGGLTTLASPGLDQTRRIETDGGKVYWIDQGQVASVTGDGHTQVAIASGAMSDPFTHNGLAFDSHSVFWTEMLSGAIRKATPK
jgi:hypothetical protein